MLNNEKNILIVYFYSEKYNNTKTITNKQKQCWENLRYFVVNGKNFHFVLDK